MPRRAAPTPVELLRPLLVGGDRRSIADSNRARALVEHNRRLVGALVALASDADPLVCMRAADLLEKLAHDHNDWIAPHKRVFIGPLADSDRWEIRLQVVRALPLFEWTPAQRRRVIAILSRDVEYPQMFVRAWALDSLATFAERDARLLPAVRRHLDSFERSGTKALAARARRIMRRLGATNGPPSRR